MIALNSGKSDMRHCNRFDNDIDEATDKVFAQTRPTLVTAGTLQRGTLNVGQVEE